jgi:hypothetical protein
MTVTLTVRDALMPHEVVKQPGFWFCTLCWWFSVNVPSTADPPGCPNEILGSVPWPG